MLELKRKMTADPAAGFGEVLAFVLDLYESKGSLDAFDDVTREEIEETFSLLMRLQQKRLGVRTYPFQVRSSGKK